MLNKLRNMMLRKFSYIYGVVKSTKRKKMLIIIAKELGGLFSKIIFKSLHLTFISI
jgi:hypothetical protein